MEPCTIIYLVDGHLPRDLIDGSGDRGRTQQDGDVTPNRRLMQVWTAWVGGEGFEEMHFGGIKLGVADQRM